MTNTAMRGGRPIPLAEHPRMVFFIGAGMSAESGVPTYRGAGGIWTQYRYEEFACQRAFQRDPRKVLQFHELRRDAVLACQPHAGHYALAELQQRHPQLQVITQNIDGMLQRAGVAVAAELHGSLWRLRCPAHGIRSDEFAGAYRTQRCPACDRWLRPDITWFEDAVDEALFEKAGTAIAESTLFVAIGTSAVVYPAAGLIPLALRGGALMVEINPQESEASGLFALAYREPASRAISAHFV